MTPGNRWLITGGDGTLGCEMKKLLASKNIFHIGMAKSEMDITDMKNIAKIFLEYRPTHVLNCAGITNVDYCETNPDEASAVNYQGVVNLVNLSRITESRFFQVSTNFVFDGMNKNIYSVNSIKNPLNVYGVLKSRAEDYCLNAGNPNIQVIRTASLYSEFGDNFVLTLLKNLNQGKITSVIDDIYVQPTWAYSVAKLIYSVAIFNSGPKIIHAVSTGKTNWWEFSNLLCELLNLNPKLIEKSQSSRLGLVAKRPIHAILSTVDTKYLRPPSNLFGWKSMLSQYIDQL